MNLRISYFMIPFFLLFTFSASAKKYHAVLDGNWHVPSTWDLYEVPSSADTVIIDGYTVTFDINASTDSISRVEIYNVSNANNSKLRIADASTLTVLNDLVLISYNNQKDIELKIEDFATLNIFGNVYFERTAENIESGKLSFFMLDDSRMNVIGDFNYDYKNASETEEGGFEVRLDNNSVFSVAGNTSFTIANGKEFFIELKDDASALLYGDMIMEMTGGKNFLVKTSATSTFNVQGNATLKNSGQNSSLVFGSFSNDGNFNVEGNFDIISTVANSPLTLDFSGENAKMSVKGNITMDALSDGDIKIAVKENSSLTLGGNIIRPASYGAVDMDPTGSFTFNGENPQLIPAANLPNSGTDSLKLSNLYFNNTSGEPMALEGPMVVNDKIVLSNGNIKTTAAGVLIIEEGGSIEGGSSTSFIDGPMIKRGSTNGEPFLFPIGAKGVYAPVTISGLTDSKSEYSAQYFSDPPPFGLGLAANISNVSQNGYWEIDKKENSEDIDITLHWNNGEVSDLTDMDKLVVVGMSNATDSLWNSYGRSNITGSIDPGAAGTVTSNMASDPPPFGVIFFAVGIENDVFSSIDNNIINDGKINLFPNPVEDLIQIESIDATIDEAQIEIFDQNGQQVFSNKINFNAGKYQISTHAANIQNSGIYFLRMTSEEGSRILKFTKVN